MEKYTALAKIILILALVFVASTLAGCVLNMGSRPAGHQAKLRISPELKREVLKDTQEDIDGIEQVADDPQPFSRYLAGKALADMSEEIAQDRTKGKVKMRRYTNVKLTVTHYSKGIAGVAYEFDDGSYYVARGDVGKKSFAIADRRRLALALAKRDGRWKIINILRSAASPAGTSE